VIAKATDAIKWSVNFMTDTMPYEGACHCGALQFRLNTRPPSALLRCNCSICELEDFLHWIMPLSHFEWTSGEGARTVLARVLLAIRFAQRAA